jgi:predicted TIM-barrel fold metal-dependent hydrolase
MALSLVDANAERVVWGTDWPHTDSNAKPGRKATDLAPFLAVDDRVWLQRLMGWLGKEKLVEKVLVENPARLYGF